MYAIQIGVNLVIDVGNSSVKLAVFEKGKMAYQSVAYHENWFQKITGDFDKFAIENVIISRVRGLAENDLNSLKRMYRVLEVQHNMKLPFKNHYKTPKTLGADRIALMSGAALMFPGKAVLVIDAGSCITYDYKNENEDYFGGAISPGLQMRYKAVHHFTGKLPLLSPIIPETQMGNSTENAIHKGILAGLRYEIQGFIDEYLSENENLTIILTGGDLDYLRNDIKNRIFANPNFLLECLNGLLDYNLIND
ncbi:MAG: type III pantothenate kinase [Bacteroidetes bacterium]|nr:type III pantothenate kinase [Bacteroidota bacterium]